jgi:hypothetical protein
MIQWIIERACGRDQGRLFWCSKRGTAAKRESCIWPVARGLRARQKSLPPDFKAFHGSLDFFVTFLVKQKSKNSLRSRILIFTTGIKTASFLAVTLNRYALEEAGAILG